MFVEIKDLKKSFKLGETNVEALRGISLSLSKGEFAGLVGPSGSGKSTLLNMLGCMDRPDHGSIKIEGKELVSMSDDEQSDFRNAHLGFIFQNFNLLPALNVFENIALPLLINPNISKAMRFERVQTALSDVALLPFAGQYPDKLSGGQRQRVAIARALVTRPTLVLADEPTASLDSENANDIIDLLLSLNHSKNVTFLFSTHDEKLISRVRKVYRLVDGKIIAS